MLRELDIKEEVSVSDNVNLSVIERGPGESCKDDPSSINARRDSEGMGTRVERTATNFLILSIILWLRASGSAMGLFCG
jgi:hypothetical protein